MYVKNKLKNDINIKIERINLLISFWNNILILFVGKNPPDEIIVKERLKASKVLKLINFNKINITSVSEA